MTSEWKDNFQPHILLRGREYAETGHVANLTVNGNDIFATVQGSGFYKVKIHMSNQRIDDAYCSCPYFEKGVYCKHLAAVMYSVSETSKITKKDQAFSETPKTIQEEQTHSGSVLAADACDNSLEERIRQAERPLLEEIVLSLAERDERNLNLVREFLPCTSSNPNDSSVQTAPQAVDVLTLQADAEQIFRFHGGRHGYIDYYSASDFTYEICGFLNSSSRILINQKRYLDAFEVTKYVYVKLGNTDIDDDGDISIISDCCWQIWTDIADACSSDELHQIKEWFKKHCNDGTVIDYMEDTLQDFLRKVLITAEEMQAEMLELDEKLGKGVPNDVTRCYQHEEDVRRRVFLMKKLGASDEEIQEFWFSHDEIEDVRRDILENTHEKGEYGKEIQLLNHYRESTGSGYKKIDYTETLIELYHLMGNQQMEKNELKRLIELKKPCTLDTFRAYKNFCGPDEWESERELILSKMSDMEQRCRILLEEKLYERLFEEISKSGQIGLYNQYGFLLDEEYGCEILRFYKGYVESLAVDARNQSRYRQMVAYLNRMQQYVGGEELVKALAYDLAQKYPTRKLMVEELSKFY